MGGSTLGGNSMGASKLGQSFAPVPEPNLQQRIEDVYKAWDTNSADGGCKFQARDSIDLDFQVLMSNPVSSIGFTILSIRPK
jgi:hypothetical protein